MKERDPSNDDNISVCKSQPRSAKAGDSRPQSSAGKKKSGGILGFLTLKEPSSTAWEEFAEQQRRLEAQKSSGTRIVGMPGVSSQKLPEYVPPVNSKWDGLPDTASPRKDSAYHGRPSAPRSSNVSSTTALSSRSGRSSSSRGSAHDSASGARYHASTSSQSGSLASIASSQNDAPSAPTSQAQRPQGVGIEHRDLPSRDVKRTASTAAPSIGSVRRTATGSGGDSRVSATREGSEAAPRDLVEPPRLPESSGRQKDSAKKSFMGLGRR